MPTNKQLIEAIRSTEAAQRAFYKIAGGDYGSGNVGLSSISAADRIQFWLSRPFRRFVNAQRACGREVFHLKDLDKTQAAGDTFTFFFQFRADRGMFTDRQLDRMGSFLKRKRLSVPKSRCAFPHEILRLWWQHEETGKDGIPLLTFWRLYWATQVGLTRDQKNTMVEQFAPHYSGRVYPDTAADNEALAKVGVHPVIVSNGDHDILKAVAPYLGLSPDNCIGSRLKYNPKTGLSAGVNLGYEMFDEDWTKRPQHGKALTFHLWLWENRARFGWKSLDERKVVISAREGDSASADGGMMLTMPWPSAIGNFIVNTPGEAGRAQRFYPLMGRYSWTPGSTVTLQHRASRLSAKP